jgi:hypothetical protein
MALPIEEAVEVRASISRRAVLALPTGTDREELRDMRITLSGFPDWSEWRPINLSGSAPPTQLLSSPGHLA